MGIEGKKGKRRPTAGSEADVGAVSLSLSF